MLLNDNDDDRKMMENCQLKGKRVINPIVDWEDEDVREYIKSRNIEYCKLYDEGCKRLGGCWVFDGWNKWDRKRPLKTTKIQ